MPLDTATCAVLLMALAGQQCAAKAVQHGVAAAASSHIEARLELSQVSSSQPHRRLQQGSGSAAASTVPQPHSLQPPLVPALDAALVSAALKWSSQQLLKAYLSVPSGKEPQQVGRKT